MDRLVTPKAVAERYGCSLATARKYIRQCNPYMEKPLATTQLAFAKWEASRMYGHVDMKRVTGALMKGLREQARVPRRKD